MSKEVPAEAVNAAMKAYRAKVDWIDRHSRDDYGREDELGMIAALEAATPFIAVKAFSEGQVSGMRHAKRAAAAEAIGRPELPGPISSNPYSLRGGNA